MLVCAAWLSRFMLIHSTTAQCNCGWLWNTDNRFTHASRHSAVQFKIKLNTFRQLRNFRGPLRWQLKAKKWQNSRKAESLFFPFFTLSFALPPWAKRDEFTSSFFHWSVSLKQQIFWDALLWSAYVCCSVDCIQMCQLNSSQGTNLCSVMVWCLLYVISARIWT